MNFAKFYGSILTNRPETARFRIAAKYDILNALNRV